MGVLLMWISFCDRPIDIELGREFLAHCYHNDNRGGLIR